MISWTQAKGDHAEAEATAKALGLTYEKLTGWDAPTEEAFIGSELDKFRRSFERQFVIGVKEREIVDLYMRHRIEILVGCMVAKEQMAKSFDGERPEAGKFGMVMPRASFFGIGDNWDSVAAFSVGSPVNWIHSGTTLMAGTSGNAIKVGENAVHVIIAVGSLHKSPKIESHRFEIDGKPKPAIIMPVPTEFSDFRTKELDVAFIWKKNTTMLGKIFIGDQLGAIASGADVPFLVGATFVTEDVLRLHDPATLPGTVYDVVLTT